MADRQHVPFDVFAMQVDVPVSMLVRDGDFGWSCGQCPLDREGQVLSPGDLVAQAGHVADMIEQVLPRAGLNNGSIGKLIVYYVATSPAEAEAMLGVFRTRFPHQPVIVPIPVPHFYYDGMLIEVDVFAGRAAVSRTADAGTGIELQIKDSGPVTWAAVRCALAAGESADEGMARIGRALESHDLGSSHLLSDHWFLAGEEYSSQLKSAFVSMPDAAVLVGDGESRWLMGELTFSGDPVELEQVNDRNAQVAVTTRRSGRFAWAAATCGDGTLDLVGQTRPLMEGIKGALAEAGMTFKNVTKLTAHYVGGASEEELHGNMQVRHSYYGTPGPASTGLPVSGLLGRNCLLSIDVFGVADPPRTT